MLNISTLENKQKKCQLMTIWHFSIAIIIELLFNYQVAAVQDFPYLPAVAQR